MPVTLTLASAQKLDSNQGFIFKKQADSGDVNSQCNVAFCYTYSLAGFPCDIKLAFEYHKMAAQRNDAYAQAKLGCAYLNGHGVPQNYEKAIYWLKRAEKQHSSIAQVALGYIEEYGVGSRGTKSNNPNMSKAALYYHSAAIQGNAEARLALSRFFQDGLGDFEKNTVMSDKLHCLAIAQIKQNVSYNYLSFNSTLNGDFVVEVSRNIPNPEFVKKIKREEAKQLEENIGQCDAYELYLLGLYLIYVEAEQQPEQYSKFIEQGISLLERAIYLGNLEALYFYTQCINWELGVVRDLRYSYILKEVAAKNGHSLAIKELNTQLLRYPKPEKKLTVEIFEKRKEFAASHGKMGMAQAKEKALQFTKNPDVNIGKREYSGQGFRKVIRR